MGYTWAQLPLLGDPSLVDSLVVGHVADGNLYQSSLQDIANLIGGGSFAFDYAVDLSALTIFNFGNYTAIPNNTITANTVAMTNMLNDLANAVPQGGEVWIPQFNYSISAASFQMSSGIKMRALGTGGGGQGMPSLFHFQVTGDGLLFNVLGIGGHTLGGVRFEDLGFGYPSGSPAVLGTSTAIWGQAENVRAVRCSFNNYPTAMICDGLSNGLEMCSINYQVGPAGTGPNVAGQFAAVYLQSPECYAVGPGEFFQVKNNSSSQILNCVGIAVCGSSEHAIIRDLHIQHWSYGVSFNVLPAMGESGTGVNWPQVVNCEIASWITPVYLQPPVKPGPNYGVVYGAKFCDCTMFQDAGDSSGPFQNTNMTPIVYVDTNGGPNGGVSDVEFNNCSVFAGNQYGYQINAGSNIRIIGGMASGNGNSSTNGGQPGAGIAITGACGNVLVNGVDLNAKFAGSSSPNQAQTYAVLVTSNPALDVQIVNCDMSGSGYSGSPVHVTPATPANFYVNNCPGYNDQQTVIGSGVAQGGSLPDYPASGGISASVAAANLNAGVSYFGPSIIAGVNGGSPTTLHRNGGPYTIPANAFFSLYIVSPYEPIFFSGTLATFSWIGY